MRPNAERRPREDAAETIAPLWYAILHPPPRLWLLCSECHYSALNELNQLRRAGWTETATTPRRYRCGGCSEAAS